MQKTLRDMRLINGLDMAGMDLAIEAKRAKQDETKIKVEQLKILEKADKEGDPENALKLVSKLQEALDGSVAEQRSLAERLGRAIHDVTAGPLEAKIRQLKEKLASTIEKRKREEEEVKKKQASEVGLLATIAATAVVANTPLALEPSDVGDEDIEHEEEVPTIARKEAEDAVTIEIEDLGSDKLSTSTEKETPSYLGF